MQKILFVDDDRQIVDALGNILRRRRANWQVRSACSATDAIKELEREPADVVVTDLRMPETDGKQLLRTIEERWPTIIRVVLSGEIDHDPSTLEHAHFVLTKPVESKTLLATLDLITHTLEYRMNQ